ncbi:hypothetical protein [Aeromicrobium chenweiae]|nr:hypothetical protein [Aeromicrobium chenweiae]TGN32999.1 hypothetical protein E4L97_09995 [Aeromicrobium chenweiae]
MADESIAGGLICISQRRDRVYVTTDRELARVYAGTWRNPDTAELGRGALYRVEVKEGLEEDEDLLSLPGLSFQAPSATVIAVYDAAVKPDAPKYGRVLKRTLDDHAAAKARDATTGLDGQ